MKLGQDVVVKHAARAPVEHLALSQPLALEHHQAARQLGAGQAVEQPLTAGARNIDFLLGV